LPLGYARAIARQPETAELPIVFVTATEELVIDVSSGGAGNV
jgi:hypothetical protein